MKTAQCFMGDNRFVFRIVIYDWYFSFLNKLTRWCRNSKRQWPVRPPSRL